MTEPHTERFLQWEQREHAQRLKARRFILGSFGAMAILGAGVLAWNVTREGPNPKAIAPESPAPAVEPEEPVATAGLSEKAAKARALSDEQIRSVLGSHEQDVTSCYQREAASGRTPPEKVNLVLRIQPSGAVTDTRIESPVAAPVARCIENKVGTWRFPADEKRPPQDVNVPLILVPSQS